MLFKLVNNAILCLAAFYVAENTGLIERGKYFPSLPRLEASASDPMAWIGAAQWGVARLTHMAKENEVTSPVADAIQDPRRLTLDNVTTFGKRLEAKRNEVIESYGIQMDNRVTPSGSYN